MKFLNEEHLTNYINLNLYFAQPIQREWERHYALAYLLSVPAHYPIKISEYDSGVLYIHEAISGDNPFELKLLDDVLEEKMKLFKLLMNTTSDRVSSIIRGVRLEMWKCIDNQADDFLIGSQLIEILENANACRNYTLAAFPVFPNDTKNWM